MIIMGTLGVLAAITIPNFIKARSTGHRSACIANLKQIQDAKRTWSMEHDESETAVPTDSDLYGPDKYLLYPPACPSEGVYELGAVGTATTCSQAEAEGHKI